MKRLIDITDIAIKNDKKLIHNIEKDKLFNEPSYVIKNIILDKIDKKGLVKFKKVKNNYSKELTLIKKKDKEIIGIAKIVSAKSGFINIEYYLYNEYKLTNRFKKFMEKIKDVNL